MVFAMMLVVFTCCLASQASTATNQLLVKVEGGPSSAVAGAADAAVGARVIRRYENVGWYLVETPEFLSVPEAITLYKAQPGVLKVEPNAALRQPAPVPQQLPQAVEANSSIEALSTGGLKPNDPQYSSQWNLKKIGMESAWSVTSGSSNVVVAVIDTGVDYRHPDLAANMWRNPGETGLDANGNDKATNGIDDDNDGYVDDVFGVDTIAGTGDPMDKGYTNPPLTPDPIYHGTGCAGLIGAVGNNRLGIAGLNWNVRIMAIAADYGDMSIPRRNERLSYLLAAYDYLLLMKRRGVNIRAVNHSINGSTASEAFGDALAAAAREGLLFVFAAGNDSRNQDIGWWIFSMLDEPNIISVTGTDRSDQLIYDYGRTSVDLAAPATGIPSLWKGGTYASDLQGSSFAAPQVTGAAALLCAARPEITIDQLKAALFGSVDILPSLAGKTRTNGRLNVARALGSLTNASAPIVTYAAPGGLRTKPDAAIQVTFNQPMNPSSVEAAFSLNPPVSGSFEWSADNRSFTFHHLGPFQRTNYTATIAGTAVSALGDTLDGNFDRTVQASPEDDYVWNFDFATPNDDLAGAEILQGGEGSTTGNNEHTVAGEAGEPDTLEEAGIYLDSSLWYRWIAPSDGWFTFDTLSGKTLNTTLGIFRGTNYQTLTELASNNNYGSRKPSRISFNAMAGETYSLAVGADSSDAAVPGFGTFTLRWGATPPPTITSLSTTQSFPGTTIVINGTNFTGVTTVKFNDKSATFQKTNASFLDLRLRVTIPADASSGPITLETPHGSFTTTNAFTIQALPVLNIEAVAEGQVILSWPDDPAGFQLQASDGLGANAGWLSLNSLPDAPPVVPGYVRRMDTIQKSMRFYRLKHP